MPARQVILARAGQRWRTVPNALAAVRLLGSPSLLLLAYARAEGLFLGLLAALMVLDWLDGKLARWLDQRTLVGSRLDSIADATMYLCAAVGVAWLRPRLIADEIPWLLAILGSYLLSLTAALVRFRCLPSYHTWGAKLSWLLIALGLLVFFVWERSWMFRAAAAVVVLTNLEATGISLLLRQPARDVRSIVHALRHRGRAAR